MNLSNELTKQVNAHLSEVRKYLGELPADERQEILQSVESHIYDALERRSDGQPTPELLAAVIAEMDPPESYGELSALKKKKFCWYIAIIVLTSIALMAIGIIWWPQQQSNPIETAHKKKSSQDGQSFQSMTRPVEHPSTPQPPSGKYAFQIIKIEAPEKIIPKNEIDIEAIIQYPEATVFEYPTLIAGLGESITNDQTKSISMTTDGYGIEGKPIKLGSLTSVSVKETSETTVSYHILVSLKLLVGFTGSKIENGFTVKTNPIFKVRNIDTDQTQRFNSWRVLSELVQQKPNEEPIKELICIQVISPDKTHKKPEPLITGKTNAIGTTSVIKLVLLSESVDGVRVGLKDTSTNPPLSYFMLVGEQEHGIEVVQADPKKGSALIRRNGQDIYLELKASSTHLPDPVGHWQGLDFVESIEQFDPSSKHWRGDFDLKELTFLPYGKTDRPYWTWNNGVLHHSDDNTDAQFFIKKIDGEDYLFLEWISKDVIEPGFPPKLYVFKEAQ